MMRSRRSWVWLGALTLGALWGPASGQAQAQAQVPTVVPYVGMLSFDTGAPYDGTIDVAVSLYPGASAADPLWGPVTFAAVPVQGGIFSLALGGPAAPGFGVALEGVSEAWLSFSIGGQLLAPRQQLLSVPYALYAQQAGFAADAATVGGMAPSQLGGVSGGGVAGRLALFSDTEQLASSSVVEDASGQIGVGVAAPAAALHVGGGLLVEGRLDADGGLRLGAIDAPCTASLAGSLRFSAGVFEGCDGDTWRALGTSSLVGLVPTAPAASCQEVKAAQPGAPSGLYWLDPDGPGGMASFEAYCDMASAGGGWTLCATLGHQKLGNGLTFTTSLWNTGSYAFLSSPSAPVTDYGNFCSALSIGEMWGQIRTAPATITLSTGPVPVTGGNPFSTPGLNHYSAPGSFLGVINRSSMATNGIFFGNASCGTTTNSNAQGSCTCIGNGSTFLATLGNINNSTNGDWMCELDGACGQGNNIQLFFAR